MNACSLKFIDLSFFSSIIINNNNIFDSAYVNYACPNCVFSNYFDPTIKNSYICKMHF